MYRRELTIGNRFILGVVYWFVWTIAIPRWQGTKLEEYTQILDDGTSITKLRYA